MALSVNSVYECNASGTANNVNGGGFNPSNTNMLADLTTDANTANTDDPIISSASYNFVAGDVGHWVYIKSGTNWTPGWYKISAVAANKATLMAAIGEAVQVTTTQGNPSPKYKANTVAGVATVGTPTSGTFTIDYSQGTAAIIHSTDGTSTASTTFTSVTGGFTKVMIGNYLHLISATGADEIVGWYEVVNVTDGNTITLDRVSGTYTLADFYIGGAMSLNSTLDDDFFEIMLGTNGTGANRIFMKSGSFSLGEAISITADGGTGAPITIEGYNSLRGDNPVGTNRPSINQAANAVTLGGNWNVYNTILTGTAASMLTSGATNFYDNCKLVNTSTTAARNAFVIASIICLNRCELISYRGRALNTNNNGFNMNFCYVHDSDIGINASAAYPQNAIFYNCIISDNVTKAFEATSMTGAFHILGCTLYGAENKLGIGLNIGTGSEDFRIVNTIIAGFTSGIVNADVQTVGYDDYNDYYNNTTDVSNWQKGQNSIAVNPAFTSVAQLTGSTATTSGSVLTQSGGDFSTVTDNVDFVYIKSGTGVTAGKYLITSHTSTTITLDIAPGTNATADKVWQITTGHNFLPTGSI